MKVVEKFVSINGESTHAGELAVFIRFKGCNLKCSYCDTKWANEPDCAYDEMTPEEIYEYILSTKVKNVTLTGGEPLLQKDIEKLLALIVNDKSLRVEIETNGAVALDAFCKENRPHFTMDYKLPSSECEKFMVMDNFGLLGEDDVVKFVSESIQDLEKAYELIRKYKLTERCHVYFSPVFGSIEPVEIVDFMIKNNINSARLQIQMHKVIWNPDERGV